MGHKAAIISFEKERVKRERARAKEEADAKRATAKRSKAIAGAKEALEDAEKEHQTRREKPQREQAALDRRVEEEEDRWNKMRRKLQSALDQARRG